MAGHKVGTREEWLAAHKALLEQEEEHAARGDELAELRKELPWVRVDKEYSFETDEGPKTLAELFEGRSQLLIYHLMSGPSTQEPALAYKRRMGWKFPWVSSYGRDFNYDFGFAFNEEQMAEDEFRTLIDEYEDARTRS